MQQTDMKYLQFQDDRTPNNRSKSQSKISDQSQLQSPPNYIPQYDALKIPPNWDIARNHGLARRVAPRHLDDTIQQEVCPCCSYAIYREDLSITDDIMKLSPFGAGFPLYFNFIKYCIILVIILVLGTGISGLYMNTNGNYCSKTQADISAAVAKGESIKKMCIQDGISTLTLVNRLKSVEDNSHNLTIDFYLQISTVLLIMFTLLIFRRSQYLINQKCDIDNLTPADYTVRAFNIPVDNSQLIEQSFKNVFPDIIVSKITFCYDSSPIDKIQSQIMAIVKQKQKYLQSLIVFNEQDPKVLEFDSQIKQLQNQKKIISQQILEGNGKEKNFTSVAFVSFETEHMKNQVIDTGSFEIQGQKMKIIQAAEPTDIIWSGINHVSKGVEKFKARVNSWIQWGLMVGICFLAILGISTIQKQIVASMNSGVTTTQFGQFFVTVVTLTIPIFLNVFNKFLFGPFLKNISVAKELWGTKTKMMVAFSIKLSLGGFINMVVLIICNDIYIFNNIYQPGGFIYTVDKVFYMNAFVTILIYLIDPWNIQKSLEQSKHQKVNKSYLTQQEANELMEYPVYGIARRYSDSLKTVWMTFFFESFMPFNAIYSLIGLIALYWTDKYNLFKRRTVKDSISIELSTNMIDLLETIILFQVGGSFYFNRIVLGRDHNGYCFIVLAGIIYSLLPLDKIVQKLFGLKKDFEEQQKYSNISHMFETDYDRENPILKESANQKFLQQQSQAIVKRKMK